MSVRPDPVIPETRRRRASTTEKSERILKMSRSLTLTRSVLAGTLAEATPNQLDFIERWLVVPEFLRTLVFARPRGDDQFADCTFSPSLDMSR